MGSWRWLLLLMSCSFSALAADPVNYVIGIEERDQLPTFKMQGNQFSGYAYELFKLFAAHKGMTFTYQRFSGHRLNAALEQGLVDFQFPDNPNWHEMTPRAGEIFYSDPVVESITGTLVVKAEPLAHVESIKTLGLIEGQTPTPWLERIRQGQVKVKEYRRLSILLHQLLIGRIDAGYANLAMVDEQLKKLFQAPDALILNPALPLSKDQYHLATRKHSEVLREFNRWLRENPEMIAALKRQIGVEKNLTN